MRVAFGVLAILYPSICIGETDRETWESTTESFLSGLQLMQGPKDSFTPDTYYGPGGVICVVANGEVQFCRPFGYREANDIKELAGQPALPFNPNLGKPVEERSLFRLGSTSKLFVGLSLAICKNQGLVDYDETVSKYLNEFSESNVGRLTLKQLFTHSGGLIPLHKPDLRERDDEVTNATTEEILGGILKLTPDDSKLGRFSYSNIGILLLAEVVSRVQDLPFEAFVAKSILEPLEMSNTYFHTSQIDSSLKTTGYYPNFTSAIDPDLQGYAPVGGMYSTGPDMAKLMGFLQDALKSDSNRPLPIEPQVVRDLATVYLKEGDRAMGVSLDIGYRNGQTMLGHNGRINGYASFFTFAKESSMGIVFLSNGGFPLGRTTAPELLNRLLQAYPHD